ncbi:MAG: hypothetical protein JKX84_05220 [Flavobacteriales bacterium]|nr:hypothetical protein [Flavobacteriales bacterium]
MSCIQVQADVGQTYELKRQRRELILQKETYGSAGIQSNFLQINELNERIINLDQQIFSSYQHSIDHMVAQKAERSTNDRFLVALSMVACGIALVFSILILMARNRVVEKENMGLLGVYRQLSNDFMKKVSPEKAGENRLLRVNMVVITGLVMMGISILAFLIGSI